MTVSFGTNAYDVEQQSATTWWSGVGRVRRSATWPFARLHVGGDLIKISSIFGTTQITRKNVVSISRFRGATATGLRFAVADTAEVVVFWLLQYQKTAHESAMSSSRMSSLPEPSISVL